jgi:hypothetical protein
MNTMTYGFDNDIFYIDMPTISRPVINMREENDKRALEIAHMSNKIYLGMSTGVDSQAMLHAFRTQDIPVECVFMYLPGYNDVEYNRIPLVEQRWGISIHILDMDVMKLEPEIINYANKERMSPITVVHRLFAQMLPDDVDLVQMIHDPFVYVSTKKELYYYQRYNSPEFSRPRAIEDLGRSGKFIAYGDTIEFLYSILNDDTFKGAFYANEYFDGNGLIKPGVDIHLQTSDRWDYYIKPIIYGKYWRDELLYFPKFGGWENIPFMKGIYAGETLEDDSEKWSREHGILMKYHNLLNHLSVINGAAKRYHTNINV